MKATKWYVKYPADAYAIGPVEFNEAVEEPRVRQWARDFDGIKRLPQGFECWPVNPDINNIHVYD